MKLKLQRRTDPHPETLIAITTSANCLKNHSTDWKSIACGSYYFNFGPLVNHMNLNKESKMQSLLN